MASERRSYVPALAQEEPEPGNYNDQNRSKWALIAFAILNELLENPRPHTVAELAATGGTTEETALRTIYAGMEARCISPCPGGYVASGEFRERNRKFLLNVQRANLQLSRVIAAHTITVDEEEAR